MATDLCRMELKRKEKALENVQGSVSVCIIKPACFRRLERRLGVYGVGTGKSMRAKERLDV